MGPVDAPRPTLNIAGFGCGLCANRQLLQLAVIFAGYSGKLSRTSCLDLRGVEERGTSKGMDETGGAITG